MLDEFIKEYLKSLKADRERLHLKIEHLHREDTAVLYSRYMKLIERNESLTLKLIKIVI